MQMLWKSISTSFPFTIRGGNAGTNNEKRVAYSRLSTQEKESEVEVDVDPDARNSEQDFYKLTSSKSSNELTNNNITTSPTSTQKNQNGNEPIPVIMKHSVSMDWKLGTVLNSTISQKKSTSTLSTWRKTNQNTNESADDKIEKSKNDKVNDLFQRVQSHSKFLSGVIFNDECDASDLDEEEDKGFYCEVCERSFPTIKRLYTHQDRKRHFGCLQCDSIFPSRENLECHQEQMGHFDFVSDHGSDTTYDSDEEDLLQEDECSTTGSNGNSFV